MKSSIHMTLTRLVIPVVAAIALVQGASAAFTINYSVEGSPPPAASTLFGPNGVPAGTETWNQSGAQTVTGLLDAAGAATPANLNWAVSSSPGVDEWGNSSIPVLRYSARDFNTDPSNFITMTLSGLTVGDTYTVWIASGRPSATVTGGWSTTNTTSTLGTQLIDNSALNNTGTSWVQGNNYVLFNNVVVDLSGNLVMKGVSTGGTRLPFSGFQIAAVPEPSAALLGALGSLALLRRRRA